MLIQFVLEITDCQYFVELVIPNPLSAVVKSLSQDAPFLLGHNLIQQATSIRLTLKDALLGFSRYFS